MTMDDALRSELDYKRTSFAREQQPDAGIAGIDTGPTVSASGNQAPVGDWNYEPQSDQSWKMYPPGVTAPAAAVQGTMTAMAAPEQLSALSQTLTTQEAAPPPAPTGFSPEEMNRYLNITRTAAQITGAGGSWDDVGGEYAGYQSRLAQQSPETARALQIHARDNQLRAAGQPGVSLADQIELQQYYDRQGIPAVGPLNTQQQSRYDQILARNAETAAAGEPGVDLLDMAELRRYQAMLGVARTLPEGYTLPDRTGEAPYVPGVPTMGQPHV
jgi:hypothetical protein